MKEMLEVITSREIMLRFLAIGLIGTGVWVGGIISRLGSLLLWLPYLISITADLIIQSSPGTRKSEEAEMTKIYLPFKARHEIGKILLRDNPNQKEEIVAWVISQDGNASLNYASKRRKKTRKRQEL